LSEPITKSSLSEPQCRLIELLQSLNFGRVEALHVRNGVPVFEPRPRVIQTLKMGGHNAPREEVSLKDFWLKEPVIDLLQTIAKIGEGEVITITVMHGLPQIVEIQHDVHD
jgi:hypothetical protein